MNKLNLVGQRFGRLTVIASAPSMNKRTLWRCRCDCENEVVVESYSLRKLHTQSCGCYARDRTIETSTKHGKANKCPEYKAWKEIKNRCLNVNYHGWRDYGGRGISVCEHWLNSFENFLDDMGPRPSSKHSIDRKHVNGNYEKDNCRWATQLEQANNKRNNLPITYQGIRYPSISVFARELGISESRLRYQISKQTINEAVAKAILLERG